MSNNRELADLAGFTPRNYAGAAQVANNAAPSIVSGGFYNMNLSAGVQIFNLPAVAGIKDGHSVVVRATGLPSGFQTAYVSAEAGKVISYRNYEHQNFHLIGKGETFRFTWLAGLNIWLAECLVQPGKIVASRTHGTGAYNGSPTAWAVLPFDALGGADAAAFAVNGSYTYLPVIGTWFHKYRVYYWGSNGTAGTGNLISVSESGVTDSSRAYAQVYFGAGETGNVEIEWSAVHKNADQSGANILASNVYIYYYMANSYGSITLESR